MQDMVTGLVKCNWNEEHKNMVQVEYYLGESGYMQADWMPVMMPYAGPEYGMYMMPEVGAEVVVGFRFGDRNKPFVMGALLGNVNTVQGENATENNSVRMLKTKAGFAVSVDEENHKLSFTDPGGQNTVSWSTEEDHGCLVLDSKEKVQIHLGGEEYLTLEKEKVTFAGKITVSAEEIVLKAEKNISLESGQAMTLKPDQKLILKGQNIEASPDQGFKLGGMKADIGPSQQLNLKTMQLKLEGTTVEASAQASLKLGASGITEIKGGMVKLN